ncbi:sensor domain-containing protein [Streptomyces sp. NPDC026206]|uniref:sensor histidine kinase n=1 Tax=Streptomyces sp. NPDC026206 TaxID=3157089 RepID=UPI0033CCC269
MAIDYGTHDQPGTAPRPHRVPAVLRAPVEGRTWREFLYLLTSLPVAVVIFAYTVTMTVLGVGLLVTFLGVPVLAGTLAGARGLGAFERARARALLRLDVAAPGPVRPRRRRAGKKAGGGLMSWVGALLKDGASWRHVLYGVLHLPWAIFAFTVSFAVWAVSWSLFLYPAYKWIYPKYAGQPGMQVYGDDTGRALYLDTPFEIGATGAIGLLLVLAAPWIIRGLAGVDRLMVSGLLGPSQLAARMWELEEGRGVVVDTAAADLRRIERELHDGAQARLSALAVDLGLAKEKLLEDPEAGARMVDEAHGEVKLALQELRDLARGIHPAILTDRGLGPALSSLAARCTVPVTAEVDLPARPAPAIEGIAYFTVTELLRNVSKHSRARTARVELWRRGDRLLIQVRDDGTGGASTTTGSGLAGLAERLKAVGGLLLVDSPAGGPTTVTAELPWRG